MADFLNTAPYRGTRDFLPEEMSVRLQVFETLYRVIETFGFQRYDGPILEPVEVYEAKSGVELAEKQLYQLTDKAGRRLALRPEMTPSVARMIAANAGRLHFPVRWYSHPNCHRYEKPQRGRVREHWQINVDIFGSESVEAEVEIFELIHAMLGALGAPRSAYELRVNDRVLMLGALAHHAGVPPEAQKGVLSVLDRWEKVPEETSRGQLGALGLAAAQIDKVAGLTRLDLDGFLALLPGEEARTSPVLRILREGLLEAPLAFNPLIVRGLDYYTSTVFEVFDVSPENRRSIFGGGRYDNLTELFSKQRIPGIGFGMGDVTLFDFLGSHGLLPAPDVAPQVLVLCQEEALRSAARAIAAALRAAGLRVVTPLEAAGLGKELKRASQRGIRFAVIVGKDEEARGAAALRDLLRSEQREVARGDLAAAIQAALGRR